MGVRETDWSCVGVVYSGEVVDARFWGSSVFAAGVECDYGGVWRCGMYIWFSVECMMMDGNEFIGFSVVFGCVFDTKHKKLEKDV